VKGQTTASMLKIAGRKGTRDLSNTPGRQTGRYRIYVMVPHSTRSLKNPEAASAPHEPATLSGEPTAQSHTLAQFDQAIYEVPVVSGKAVEVTASNPLSFSPVKPIALSSELPLRTRFKFACSFKGTQKSRPVFVSLSFVGSDAGGTSHQWNSQWQPIGIPLSSGTWLPTSFSDEIPDDVLRLKNLRVEILFSPFQPDYLFLRRKAALKCKMEVRDAKFSLLKPLPLPAIESLDWDVY
jgi:hypothetical protein